MIQPVSDQNSQRPQAASDDISPGLITGGLSLLPVQCWLLAALQQPAATQTPWRSQAMRCLPYEPHTQYYINYKRS